MKTLLFLILFLALPGDAPGQPDPGTGLPETGTAGATSTIPGLAACLHCSEAEQLIIDLNYYKQVLNLLEQINQQRDKIDPQLLKSVHAVLVKTRPDLAGILKTRPKPQSKSAKPAKKERRPVKKPTGKKAPARPAKKPVPRKGIEGLVVGHVNEGNKALGVQPSVVLVKDGRPFSLSIGATLEHNRRTYKILKADFIEDPQKGNRHEVRLQDQTSKKIHVVPWQ